eukprot:362047-Chlamydomonas_euryale.AAC.2
MMPSASHASDSACRQRPTRPSTDSKRRGTSLGPSSERDCGTGALVGSGWRGHVSRGRRGEEGRREQVPLGVEGRWRRSERVGGMEIHVILEEWIDGWMDGWMEAWGQSERRRGFM